MCICVCICANNVQILGFGGVGGVRSGGGYHWGGRGGGCGGPGTGLIYIHVYIYIYQYCVWYVYDICEYRLMKILAVLAQPLKTYRLCPQQRSAAWCLCEAATGRMLVKAVPEGCSHWPCSAERANFCAINRCWNLAAYMLYIYIIMYSIYTYMHIHMSQRWCEDLLPMPGWLMWTFSPLGLALQPLPVSGWLRCCCVVASLPVLCWMTIPLQSTLWLLIGRV